MAKKYFTCRILSYNLSVLSWTLFPIQTFTCSKSTVETLEERVKKDVVLVFLLLTLNIFYTFSSVSVDDFEQVNASWVRIILILITYATLRPRVLFV